MRHRLVILGLLLAIVPAALAGDQPGRLLIDDFSSDPSSRWEEKIFQGRTHYMTTFQDNQTCLRAESRASASGLIHRVRFAPADYPWLHWSWRIERAIPQGDPATKAGDDYAARVYVVFPGLFFWNTRSLNYVWAGGLAQGAMRPNPFTANAIMIAVQSGNTHAGRWMTEHRNIVEDYKEAFGEPPPEAGLIAIMTDTDNTGGSATACYGPISISSSP